MRAWLLDRMGDGIDKVHLGEVADPVPGTGQVLVDLIYAGLNPADRYLAENLYPAKPQAFPLILGRDGVGIVRALGSGVSELDVGQKVHILHGFAGINFNGTFAEKLVANVDT